MVMMIRHKRSMSHPRPARPPKAEPALAPAPFVTDAIGGGAGGISASGVTAEWAACKAANERRES